MANITHTATTTTSVLPIGTKPKALQITNMGTNPVTIRLCEDGNAVFGVWIVLPFQYSTFALDNHDMFAWENVFGNTSVITTWGSSSLAIFHL